MAFDDVVEQNVKVYDVQLSEKEMQAIASVCTGFVNRLTEENRKLSDLTAASMVNALEKFKKACNGPAASILRIDY